MSSKEEVKIRPDNLQLTSFFYWGLVTTLGAGLLLSIVSAIGLCTHACSDLKSYLLFRMPFALFGIPFFSALIIFHLLSHKYSWLYVIIAVMIFGSLGAEAVFFGIQYKSGVWCPVCLTIATMVVLSALIFSAQTCIFQPRGNLNMHFIKQFFTFLPISAIGFFIALAGVSKPDPNLTAMNNMEQKIEFGNHESPIKIYFVTDWFCAVCRQVEPLMYKITPELMKQAGFYYIDNPVHPETVNFSPYNLAFMVSDKARYPQIRRALSQLSMVNKAPNDEDIQRAVVPIGATLHELNYTDVKGGLTFFDEVIKTFKIFGTPTLIIVDTQTKRKVTLSGEEDFTEAKIFNAIKTVQRPNTAAK